MSSASGEQTQSNYRERNSVAMVSNGGAVNNTSANGGVLIMLQPAERVQNALMSYEPSQATGAGQGASYNELLGMSSFAVPVQPHSPSTHVEGGSAWLSADNASRRHFLGSASAYVQVDGGYGGSAAARYSDSANAYAENGQDVIVDEEDARSESEHQQSARSGDHTASKWTDSGSLHTRRKERGRLPASSVGSCQSALGELKAERNSDMDLDQYASNSYNSSNAHDASAAAKQQSSLPSASANSGALPLLTCELEL